MKLPFHSLLRHSAAAALTLAVTGMGHAATIAWVGDTDNDFLNVLNWPGDVALPSLSADTWQVNGTGTQGNATLNVSSPLTFTGTAGKIAFGASSGSMGLSGSDITLFQGTTDAILTAATVGNTSTIANNLILGNGSANTISLSNSGAGLLSVTGNITGGTGGTPGVSILSFGSNDGFDGNYEVTGNITAGATATALTVTLRGDGTATLSGNNTFNTLGWGGTAGTVGTVRINGGTTNITTITGSGLGGQTLRVSAGTLNVTGGARGIRTSVTVDGGIMNVSGAERLSFNGGTPSQSLTISSGELNYNSATGVRLGNSAGNTANQDGNFDFTATQTGGTFKIVGGGGTTSTLTLGGAALLAATQNKTVAYNLSGGVLDVRGSNDTNGHIVLGAGADPVTGGSTSINLSGTGKLISRFNPGAASGGIAGSQAGAAQVLSLTGGTIVAGRIEAANLRGSIGGTNGTIVNNGTTFAPGDVTANLLGRTSINGTFTQESGTLAFDLGGLTASTVFSEGIASGTFDNLLISSNFALNGGSIRINFVNGFESIITNLNTFKIVDVTGTSTFSGSFAALTTGNMTVDAYVGNSIVGSFTLDDSLNDLVLSNYTVIPEPSTFALVALGLGAAAVIRRRRRQD